MGAGPAGAPLCVVQSTQEWLTLTKTWLDRQVRSLPGDRVRSVVFCLDTAHLDRFPVQELRQVRERRLLPRLLHRAERVLVGRPTARRLRRVIDEERADLLHSHFGDWAWETLPGARATGVPHVVSFYGWDMSLLPRTEPRWLEHYAALFESVQRCLCEGPHMASRLVDLGCPPGKARVQRLGIDLDRLPFRPREAPVEGPLRVLIVGSFREKKGIPDALAALGLLRGAGVPIEITVIGDAGSLPRALREKARILDAIRRHQLGPVTRLLGYQPHPVVIQEAYEHHVFLSPSVTAADGDTEGGAPVTILELAATGMPVVTTDHCDIPYVLGGLDGGAWFAAEGAPEELAGHLRWLVSNPGAWEERLLRVRRHLDEHYDRDAVGAQLLEQYEQVIDSARCGGPP